MNRLGFASRRVLTLALVATIAALASVNGGCSVIVSGASKQCASDSDCPATATCSTEGRCLEKPQCKTTQDCIALGPSQGWQPYDDYLTAGYSGQPGGMHGMPGFGQADLVGNDATGKPFTAPIKVPTRICARGQCVALRDSGDAQCAMNLDEQQIYGDPNSPNPIVIGLMGDINLDSVNSNTPNTALASDSNYGVEHFYMRAAALPILELRQAVGAAQISGRDLLFVGCSQHRNQAGTATAPTQHLVDIGAQAIIGPTDGPSLQQAGEVAIPAGVPLISPFVLADTASQVPNAQPLLYFPSFFAPDVLGPLNSIVKNRQGVLNAIPGESALKVKVAVYYYSNGTFHEYDQLKPLIDANLQFNGSPAAPQGDAYYKTFAADLTDPTKSPGIIAQQIIAFNPDIIIAFAGTQEWFGVFETIESALSATPNQVADGNAATPIWITPLILNDQPWFTSTLISNNVNNVRARVTGTRPARNSLYPTIQSEMDRLVGATNISYVPGAARAYESSLLLFYALAAATRIDAQANPKNPLGTVTGAEISQGIAQVTSGTNALEANPSPSVLNSGLGLINSGQSIKLDGVFSPLNFDNQHHSDVIWETYCVDTTQNLNVSSRVVGSDGTLSSPSPNSPCPALGF